MNKRLTERQFLAILDSMTKREIEAPAVLLFQDRRVARIAKGAGLTPVEVRRFARAVVAVPGTRGDLRLLASLSKRAKPAA